MNPTYDFTGQVALVTGAGSGMGLVTAQAFAEAGAAVVLSDIDEGTLRSAADDLAKAGHQVLGVRCDVSDEDSVTAMPPGQRGLRPARSAEGGPGRPAP